MSYLRTTFRIASISIWTILLLLVAGCGGDDNNVFNASISGVVFDINGTPVRGAIVSFGSSTSQTNSAGSYLLTNITGAFPTVTAQLKVGSVTYVGQNSTYIATSGQQNKSVNITLIDSSKLSAISGVVYDRVGDVVGGAQVFAVANSSGTNPIYSSMAVIADNCGNYQMPNLAAGVSYTVVAAGQGFDSDQVIETMVANENRSVNFALKDPTGAAIAAPANMFATAYTSPAATSRSVDLANAIQNMKRLVNPRFASRHTAKAHLRTTPEGNFTEIDLAWDPIASQSLFGYGIYRATGSKKAMQTDVLEDPLANFYADLDAKLNVGQSYTYQMTSLNTLYGSSPDAESTPSASSTATVLGDLDIGGVDPGSVTFSWTAATGASVYAVYLFDQYPSIGVSSIWNNDVSGQQSTGTSQAYTGATVLQTGKTYYFVLVGRNADSSGVTFSQVGNFVKS